MIGRQKRARLTSAPNEAKLRQLVADASRSSSAHLIWNHADHEITYTLTVMCSSVKERRGWDRDKSSETVVPEWSLYVREIGKKRVHLWDMASGDIAIIENLIEEACAASSPASAASFEVPPSAPKDSYVEQSNTIPPKAFTGTEPEIISESIRTARTSSGVNLSGELKEVDVASILQSICLCKMTGRLNVYDSTQQIEIFFNNGELNHAISSPDTTEGICGEKVLLEVFTWDQGSFQFQHGWQTTERSVQKHLQNIVLEGATLRDYKNALEKSGVTPSATLYRAETNLSESQFEAKLANGLPQYLDYQKKIFLALREPHTLAEILDVVPMDRITWIPVVYSLITSRLIAARTVSTETSPHDQCADAFADVAELIRNAERGLLQPDSGMLSYGLFLSFAEKEVARRLAFCLAMFEFSAPGAFLTNESLKTVATAFNTMKRPYDHISLWQPNRVLLLFPMSREEEISRRLNPFLDSLAEQGSMNGVTLVGGLACAPKDGIQLNDVLATSFRLLKKAQQANLRIATSILS